MHAERGPVTGSKEAVLRVFRIFVSSTFIDLQAEREALQAFVFPRLRELCARYGARFQAVDLRWGISPDAADDQQTLDICLREVERCQRLTPRPNFLILLGDRYGWRPLPPAVPPADLAAIEAATGEAGVREQIREWYRPDDNAIPPVFVLRPRTDEAMGAWPDIERTLAAALRRAAVRLQWPPERAAPYVSSATEREIERGLFRSAAREHVVAVGRVVAGLPRDGGTSALLDIGPDGSPDVEAAGLLDELKRRLRSQLGPQMVEIGAAWAENGLSPGYIGSLPSSLDACLPLLDVPVVPTTVCAAVWHELGSVIRAECLQAQARSPLDRERDAHAAFRDGRSLVVVGRDAELARIAAYIDSNDLGPLAVLGGFGSGKSTLMARGVADAAAALARGARAGQLVFRFIGATAASTSGVQLLRGLGAEILAADGVVDEPPATLKALTEWFPQALSRASSRRPLTIFIDALDQLAANDGARTLAWLPHMLPPGVRVIVSAAPGDVTGVLEGRQPEQAILRVAALARASGAELLDTWLRTAGRSLNAEQRREVLDSFSRTGLPLHLRLLFEEARRWRSFDPPADLADDAKGLVRQLFARLSREANHGPVLVRRSLGYLSASRNGLTEDEMIDILSADTSVMDDVRRRSPNSPATNRLPPVVWSRLYDELEPYLVWRDADRTSTLAFFHRQLAEVAAREFLEDGDRRERHAHLADYFDEQPRAIGEPPAPHARRLSELPWQLAGAGRWERFVETVADFAYLDARIRTAGPQAVIDDLDLALEDGAARAVLAAPAIEALSTLRSLARLTAHILGRDPSQLGGQIAGRVDPHGNAILASVVAAAKAQEPVPSLQPADVTLAPPGGNLIATLAGHGKRVGAVGITPDATLGVSGSADGTVRVWDLDEQVERFVIPVGHGEVWSLAVTPDGRSVVSGSDDGSIDVWNLASGALIRRWQGERRWRALVLTPDGTRLISGSEGPALLWDFASASILAPIQASRATTVIAISADGRLMMIGGMYDEVTLWDLAGNRSIVQWHQGNDSWVSAVALTPDGRHAFSADWEGRTKVWDVQTRSQVGQLVGHGYTKVTAIAVTADGSKVVTADDHGRIVVHRGVHPNAAHEHIADVVLKVVDTTGHRVQQLAVTPDGTRAITSGLDSTVRVWDLSVDAAAQGHVYDGGYSDEHDEERGARLWRRVFVTDGHAAAAPAFDVRWFPAAPGDGWTVVPKRRSRPDWLSDDEGPMATAFSVVDQTGTERSPEIDSGWWVTPPAVSTDGRLVASIGFDCCVSVWELTTGRRLHVWPFDASWSPAADMGTGGFRDPRPGDSQMWQRLWKAAIVFAPDGATLLCALDGMIALWALDTGSRLTSPVGPFEWDGPKHGLPAERSPRFTPDGGHVLAMHASRYAGVWRVGQRNPVARCLIAQTDKAGFAPDGRTAWWFADGRVHHWSIVPRSGRRARSPGPDKSSFGRAGLFQVTTPSVRMSTDGNFALGIDAGRVKIWQLAHRAPVIEMEAAGVASAAMALTAVGRRRSGLRGLLARGSTRLEVFELPSMAPVASLDADAPFEACSFETLSTIVGRTADGRCHRVRLVRSERSAEADAIARNLSQRRTG